MVEILGVEVAMVFLLVAAAAGCQEFQWVEYQEVVWVDPDHQGVAGEASCCHHL